MFTPAFSKTRPDERMQDEPSPPSGRIQASRMNLVGEVEKEEDEEEVEEEDGEEGSGGERASIVSRVRTI